MSKVYVMGDCHFGHRGILKYRTQFSSTEEHDETIMDGILSTCSKRDSLWLLGDCFFEPDSLRFLRRMQHIGQVNFVAGNHDTENNSRQKIFRTMLREDLVNKVGAIFKHNNVWLTHAPLHPCSLRGLLNVHGHVHNVSIPDDRYFNASCENINYVPAVLSKGKIGT